MNDNKNQNFLNKYGLVNDFAKNLESNKNILYLKNNLYYKNFIIIIHLILLLIDIVVMIIAIFKEINLSHFFNFDLSFIECIKNMLLLEFYLIIISLLSSLPIITFAILKFKLNKKTIYINAILLFIMILEILCILKYKEFKFLNNFKIVFIFILFLLIILLSLYIYNIYKFIYLNKKERIENKIMLQNQSINEVSVK